MRCGLLRGDMVVGRVDGQVAVSMNVMYPKQKHSLWLQGIVMGVGVVIVAVQALTVDKFGYERGCNESASFFNSVKALGSAFEITFIMNRKATILFFLNALLIGCNSPNKENVLEQKPNEVVLIFDQCLKNSTYTWPDGVTSGHAPPFEVRYIDHRNIIRRFTPAYAPEKDTLVIKTMRNTIEVQHAYRGIDVLSYLFRNGDSVVFTYDSKKPIANVLNRKTKDYDVNYDIRKREHLTKDKFPGLVRVRPSFAFRDTTFKNVKNLDERVKKAEQIGIKAAVQEYQAEIEWLDSLKQQQLICLQTYNFFKAKSMFNIATLQVVSPHGSTKDESKINQPFPLLTGEQGVPPVGKLLNLQNDTLLSFFYYQDFLGKVRDFYFSSKADRIITANSNLADFRQIYDSVRISDLVNGKAKDLLLFNTINDLIDNASVNDIQNYWKKFKQDVEDTSYVSFIKRKYHVDENMSKELTLKDISDDLVTFNELLKNNQGKIIYIDFWASWCAPCIKAFPASHALQKEYQSQDVVFVYLSMDEDEIKWRKGANKHDLQQNSYLINNQYTSKMLEDLEVQGIPRYLLYDQQGKLVHRNAPGPGSDEIRKLIDQYLADS